MSKRGITAEKPLTESETRAQMFALARQIGCVVELKQLFEKYDRLLRTSRDNNERKQIALLANVELHKLFNFRDALVVGGQEILPADPNCKPEL